MEEYFDIYTIDGQPLGKSCKRGSKLGKDEYHFVVMAIMVNANGEVLLTRRSKNKTASGKWECTAGCVKAGENCRDAILREIKEETGISVIIGDEHLVSDYVEGDALFDIWKVYIEAKIEELKLQEDEVDDAKYATISEIEKMIRSGNATISLAEVIKLHEKGILKVKYQ